MTYRVVLIANGVYKKTLYQCHTRNTVFIHYNAFKNTNNVFYPKKHIATKDGIIPVKYEICVTKETEDGDVFRKLRDDYGKLYTEKPLGDWTILDSATYQIEETFFLYGMKSRGNGRPMISEIIKRLTKSAYKKNLTKQIIVVHNKLIIYNEEQFDMVVCKCKSEAQRLHHTLTKICKKQKMKNLLFMGTANQAYISRMYRLIERQTGWPITKIKRTSTKP